MWNVVLYLKRYKQQDMYYYQVFFVERNTGFKPVPSEWESEMLITNTNFANSGDSKM